MGEGGPMKFTFLTSTNVSYHSKLGTSYSMCMKFFTTLHLIVLLGIWSSPTVSGTRSPPRSGLTLTSIDENRAIAYGGWDGERGSGSSDLYLIDFQTMVGVRRNSHECLLLIRSLQEICMVIFHLPPISKYSGTSL